MNNEQRAEYARIIAQAAGDSEMIDIIYTNAINMLIEVSLMEIVRKTNEFDARDLLADVETVRDIMQATADLFNTTIGKVEADMMAAINYLEGMPDDVETAQELKDKGMLN